MAEKKHGPKKPGVKKDPPGARALGEFKGPVDLTRLSGPDLLIAQAIQSKASMDTIERMMVLRSQVRAEKAKEEYDTAMAAFQAECPVIKKTKSVKTKGGIEAYRYAPIESIVEQVKELIQKHGFHYFIRMALEGNIVKINCHIVHKAGHEQISPFEVPLGEGTNIMSKPQVVAAASTFAKRYAFLNGFGIMTGDDDDDTASERGDQPTASGGAVHSQQDTPQQKTMQNPAPASFSPAPAQQNTAGRKGYPDPKNHVYDPASDPGLKNRKGNEASRAQLSKIASDWKKYQIERGVTDEQTMDINLLKAIPWAFKDKLPAEALPQSPVELTRKQASYFIDRIGTLPKQEQASPSPSSPSPAKPAVVDAVVIEDKKDKAETAQPSPSVSTSPSATRHSLPSQEDIESFKQMFKEAQTLKQIDEYWDVIRDMKHKEQLYPGQYNELHRFYINCRVKLKELPQETPAKS